MALGFTAHYTNSEQQQPFGMLILSNNDGNESETSGSVAYANNFMIANGLLYNSICDSYEFSTSVNIDYSQYASYIASSGSAETAGSIAYDGGSYATASTVTSGASFAGGSACSVSCGGGFSNTFTC